MMKRTILYIWRVECSECGGVDYYAPHIMHNANAHYGNPSCLAAKFGMRQRKSILINSDEAQQAIAANKVEGLNATELRSLSAQPPTSANAHV